MKKLLGILVLGLLLHGCGGNQPTTKSNMLSGKIKIGMTKKNFCRTSNSFNFREDPCKNATRKENSYYPETNKEILSDSKREYFFVFENVAFPWKGGLNIKYGDGILASIERSFEEAKKIAKLSESVLVNKKRAEEEKKKKEEEKKIAEKKKKEKEKKKKTEPEPEITATDTTPPIIKIAEQIIVNDPEYVLEGRVTDKDTSKVPYLTVNKSPIKVKPDGRFKISRFSVEDEELTLVAIDEFNNKTTKIVKVKVDVKEVVVAKTYDQLQPSMVKGIKNNNRIAIIIGVEKYANTPVEALYASRDAKVFKVYANKGLGIASSNIKLLVDNGANRINTIAALKTWLPNKIIPNQSELFIFFAGHGLASDDGKELYLIPQDGNIRLLPESALSQKYIIEQIQKLKPKSVTMFFDSCYSGQSRDDKILVAGLRPIIIEVDEQKVPANFNIFSASDFDQTSGSINEVQHGIFSFYLMKGLEGKADGNQDKQITNGELITYLKTNVSKEAFTQNREQDPMLSGDPDQVLMRYR